MTLLRALRGALPLLATALVVAVTGAGCVASTAADADDEDLGTAASAVTAFAHPHPFALGMSHEIGGFNAFRKASKTPADEPRFCHIYTYWDIARHDVSEGGVLHHPKGLFDWMTQAEAACDEVLITFQGPHSKTPVKPPSADEFEAAFLAFQAWTKPGQSLEKWAGKLSYTAWNEPNNPADAGNGLMHAISPELAAQYYLRARRHCRPEQGCKVAAGDFASNTPWQDDIWRNCADDDDKDNTETHCAKPSGYDVLKGGPSYLDRYKNYLARNARAQSGDVLPSGFRPEFFAYHPWHDVNSYIDGNKACSDYESCVTRRLLESLSGTWGHSNIWDTEIGVGMQNSTEPNKHTTQPCGAAFLVRLTEMSPRFTRLYYMHYSKPAGGNGPLLDGTALRPAGQVLADRATTYGGATCADTGLDLDRYENPILPMFERPVGVAAPEGAPPSEGCPDPTGLKTSSGEYYLYCTSYTFKYARQDGFPIFKSDTLAGHRWKRVGAIIPNEGPVRSSWPTWIEKDKTGKRPGEFWAPDVHELPNGKFAALYAAPCGDTQCIGMAWSNGPAGPWTHRMNAPFLDHTNNEANPHGPATNTYDPNLLVTSTHELYLSWVVAGSGIWARQVTSEASGKLQWKRDASGKVPPPVHLQRYGEGPYLVEHDGTFYLFYSTNPTGGLVYDYQVRVRRAHAPLQSFTPACTMDSQCEIGACTAGACTGSVTVLHKSEQADGGPVKGRAFVATGGNSVIQKAVGGVDFFVYHAIVVPDEHACPRVDPTDGKNVPKDAAKNPYCRVQGDRQAMIDPITWKPDGKGGVWPFVNDGTPSTGWKMLPEDESAQTDWAKPKPQADVCTVGTPADLGDPCMVSVCQALPQCCASGWAQECVDNVPAYCASSYRCQNQCQTPAQCSGGQGCLADYTCGACVEDYDCYPKACNTTLGQCQ